MSCWWGDGPGGYPIAPLEGVFGYPQAIGFIRRCRTKKSGFTLIELLTVSIILVVLAAIAIPNFTRGQRRAKEAEVKTVAHTLQIVVEDYKATPGHEGVKPTEADIMAYLIPCFMPGMIRNPFNPYDNRFIRGGPPDSVGRIGYQYFGQDNPYIISAMGGTPGVIILTLIEGE